MGASPPPPLPSYLGANRAVFEALGQSLPTQPPRLPAIDWRDYVVDEVHLNVPAYLEAVVFRVPNLSDEDRLALHRVVLGLSLRNTTLPLPATGHTPEDILIAIQNKFLSEKELASPGVV